MTKESWFSIFRIALTAVGAYVMGKFLLGTSIDNNLWLGVSGAVMAAISIVWGIRDKTLTTERLESGLRSIVLTFGTLLVGTGVIKDELLQGLLATISIVAPTLLSEAAKRKSINVAEGKSGIEDLAGVIPETTVIAPKKETPIKTDK